jgi:hypothetical protein
MKDVEADANHAMERGRTWRRPSERNIKNMATTQVKGQAVALAKQMIAGTEKHLTGSTQVALLGSSFTPAEITTKLESLVTLRTEVDAAKAATKAKLAAESASMPSLLTFMSALRTYVKAAYGGSPDVLADFGITPKVRVPLTVEAKAAAAAKRASTRAARHTMGKQQKKEVMGDVTGVLVTPITAAPTVAAPVSPTPPAASGGTPAAPTPHTA